MSVSFYLFRSLLIFSQVDRYEDAYGKFVPDAQNAAWFAKKAPRVAELALVRVKAGKPLVAPSSASTMLMPVPAEQDRYDHPDMVMYLNAGLSFLCTVLGPVMLMHSSPCVRGRFRAPV